MLYKYTFQFLQHSLQSDLTFYRRTTDQHFKPVASRALLHTSPLRVSATDKKVLKMSYRLRGSDTFSMFTTTTQTPFKKKTIWVVLVASHLSAVTPWPTGTSPGFTIAFFSSHCCPPPSVSCRPSHRSSWREGSQS